MKLIAVVDLSLRKTPTSEEWFNWPAGTTFEAPAHMKVDLAIARRIAVPAGDKKALADAKAWRADQERLASEATAAIEEMDARG
jgi:hypothetical protein